MFKRIVQQLRYLLPSIVCSDCQWKWISFNLYLAVRPPPTIYKLSLGLTFNLTVKFRVFINFLMFMIRLNSDYLYGRCFPLLSWWTYRSSSVRKLRIRLIPYQSLLCLWAIGATLCTILTTVLSLFLEIPINCHWNWYIFQKKINNLIKGLITYILMINIYIIININSTVFRIKPFRFVSVQKPKNYFSTLKNTFLQINAKNWNALPGNTTNKRKIIKLLNMVVYLNYLTLTSDNRHRQK